MGDPDTLKNFIQYSMAKYPSQYNALVLWNHGGGVRSIDFSTAVSREICSDEQSDDILFLNELDTAIGGALSGNGGSIDIIGMDACIMGEVETAYELRNHTDYFVASMANEWGAGWDYSLIFENFSSSGNPPAPASMADILVSQYEESTYGLSNQMPNTLTAVKTAGLENLKTEIDALAVLLYDAGGSTQSDFEALRNSSVYYYDPDLEYPYGPNMITEPYHDLYSLCEQIEGSSLSAAIKTQAAAVKNALAASVAACYGRRQRFLLILIIILKPTIHRQSAVCRSWCLMERAALKGILIIRTPGGMPSPNILHPTDIHLEGLTSAHMTTTTASNHGASCLRPGMMIIPVLISEVQEWAIRRAITEFFLSFFWAAAGLLI